MFGILKPFVRARSWQAMFSFEWKNTMVNLNEHLNRKPQTLSMEYPSQLLILRPYKKKLEKVFTLPQASDRTYVHFCLNSDENVGDLSTVNSDLP